MDILFFEQINQNPLKSVNLDKLIIFKSVR